MFSLISLPNSKLASCSHKQYAITSNQDTKYVFEHFLKREIDNEQDGGSYLISTAKSFQPMHYKNNMAATLVPAFMETKGDVQLTGFWVQPCATKIVAPWNPWTGLCVPMDAHLRNTEQLN